MPIIDYNWRELANAGLEQERAEKLEQITLLTSQLSRLGKLKLEKITSELIEFVNSQEGQMEIDASLAYADEIIKK